ncbi:hypothetical protein [Paenibacillus sp. BAC0078]
MEFGPKQDRSRLNNGISAVVEATSGLGAPNNGISAVVSELIGRLLLNNDIFTVVGATSGRDAPNNGISAVISLMTPCEEPVKPFN